MVSTSSTFRRLFTLVVVPAVCILAVACAAPPDGGETPTTEPPPAKAVLSPTSGPAGSFVNVAPPDGSCLLPDSQYQSLQAALTIPRNGIVVTQGFQYLAPAFSEFASPDPYVRLRIPPATATGTYLVYLSCYSYLDQYSYAPATFTVTPG